LLKKREIFARNNGSEGSRCFLSRGDQCEAMGKEKKRWNIYLWPETMTEGCKGKGGRGRLCTEKKQWKGGRYVPDPFEVQQEWERECETWITIAESTLPARFF